MRVLVTVTVSTFFLALAGVVLLPVFARTPADAESSITLSPTPAVFDIAWDITVDEPAAQGHTVEVSALAVLTNSGRSSGGRVEDPYYTLSVESGGLVLATASTIHVDDVADGASWELLGVDHGPATVIITLHYIMAYNITGTPPGSYPVLQDTSETITVQTLLGDVDGDGSVDPTDAALVLQFDAGLLDDLADAAGDLNEDGLVDSRDASIILQYAAGLLPELDGRLASSGT